MIKDKINLWNEENNIFVELNNYYSDEVKYEFLTKDIEDYEELKNYTYENRNYDFSSLSDVNFYFKLTDETLELINEKNVIFYR